MPNNNRSSSKMRIFLTLLVIVSPWVVADKEEAGGGGQRKVTVEEVKSSEDSGVVYITPESHPDVYFSEHFDSSESFARKWVKSTAKKEGVSDESISKYDGIWSLEESVKDALFGDLGLVLKSKAKHSAISSRLKKPFLFGGKDEKKAFLVQYELNFQNGQDCGGGYLKLLSNDKDLDLKNFGDKTPYTVMFGPDKCGSDSKLHFIIRHVNPKNGSISEKHVKKLDTKERTQFEEIMKDKRPHLYRLLIRPDNSYEISIDYKIVNHGNLLHDFEPPINPPPEIDDPNDFKPQNWDDREKIPDPEASKPDDWDENEPKQILDTTAVKPDGWLDDEPDTIPDPGAEKPEDWDEDMDGEWEAPLIDNPACSAAPGCGPWSQPMIDNPLFKGKWKAPLINNPNYKGKWKPRKIENPDYYNDADPFKRLKTIGAVGIELWSMSDDIYFDNILITDSPAIADTWAADTFDLKIQKLDANDAGMIRRILLYSNRNPWLYAVYVVVVGLPLVLIVTFCCSNTGDPLKRATAAANKAHNKTEVNGKEALNDPKKTDEIQEDDEEIEEVGEEENVEDDDDDNDVDEDEEPIEEIDPKELEDDQEPLIERRTSPRKRRARKE